MYSILHRRSNIAKNLYYTNLGFTTKIFFNSIGDIELSNRIYYSNRSKVTRFTQKCTIARISPDFNFHPELFRNLRYAHTDHSSKLFSQFRTHADFSKKLSLTDRTKQDDILNLVEEWLLCFRSLDGVEFNAISGAFNSLSKLDIFGGKWIKDDRELLKNLIIRLTIDGNELLHSKNIQVNTLGPWHVTLSLNAMSKWNVLDSNEWQGSVNVNGEAITKVHLFRSFISRLIHHGNRLLEAKNIRARKFNCQEITSCLNALSRWNIAEFEGCKEFIVLLVERGNLIVNEFDSVHVSVSMKALSKWNIDEIEGAGEFIIQLMKRGNSIATGETFYKCTTTTVVGILNAMSKLNVQGYTEFINPLLKQGISMINEFTAKEIANSLNSLSKWDIEELQEAKEFIDLLINQGCAKMNSFDSQSIANSLNALSKWNIDDLPDARKFIIRMVKQGSSIAEKFNSQEIANCLNALSKWNINELNGAKEFVVQLIKCGNLSTDTCNHQTISANLNALSKWNIDEIEGAKPFIIRLISRGNFTTDVFNSQSITSTLNALSKWNIDEIKESRNFIVRLAKQGISMVDRFHSLEIVNILNALSKWNINDLQGTKEFITLLIKQGNAKIDKFDPQSICSCLTALSRWNIAQFDGAKEFTMELIKRGSSTVDRFDSQAIANCLSTLSRWNLDEFKGSRKFIVKLANQGNLSANEFTAIDIASTLNSFQRLEVFESKHWNDDQIKIFKYLIIKLIKRGENISGLFNSQSTSLSLKAISSLQIFDDEKWSKFEQKLLKNFFIKLFDVDSASKDYTLESIYRTYFALLNLNIFQNKSFNVNERNKFKDLINNLENRLYIIAKEYRSEEPDVDVRIATQLIKNFPVFKSKNLIESENHLLVSLMRCLSTSFNQCASSCLKDGFVRNHVVCSLQDLREIVNNLEQKSSLEGMFDESLSLMYNKVSKVSSSHVDELSDIISWFGHSGIIKDRKLMSM